jgi:hypothetical protein
VNTILVSGISYSGSSAVYEFLIDYKFFKMGSSEYRFFNKTYGISRVLDSLDKNVDFIAFNISLKNFKEFATNSYKKTNILSYGAGLNRYFDNRYFDALDSFIRGISYTMVNSNSYIDYVKMKRMEYFLFKLKSKLFGEQKRINFRPLTFKREELFGAVKLFHKKLFLNQNTVLDNALSIDQYLFLECFENPKWIIVLKNPIDIIADSYNHPDSVIHSPKSVSEFIEYFKIVIKNLEQIINDSRCLIIMFENFVMNHKLTKELLLAFVNETRKTSNEYNFNDSMKNINLISKIKIMSSELIELEMIYEKFKELENASILKLSNLLND